MTDLSLLYPACSHHSAASSLYKAPCPNNCQTTSSSTKQIETNTSLPYVASSCCEHNNILKSVGNFRLYSSLKIKILLLPLDRFHCTIYATLHRVSVSVIVMLFPWFKAKKVYSMDMWMCDKISAHLYVLKKR